MLKQVHAYDGLGQLVASVRSQGAGDATPTASNDHAWQEQAVWRYAYDAQQRRLLAQHIADEVPNFVTASLHRLNELTGTDVKQQAACIILDNADGISRDNTCPVNAVFREKFPLQRF